MLGAAYVFSALTAVSSIGAGAVAAATITGQLTLSVVIDRLGILGLEEQPITLERVAGVALLLTSRGALPRAVVPVEASRMLELLSPEEALDLFAQTYGRPAALDG